MHFKYYYILTCKNNHYKELENCRQVALVTCIICMLRYINDEKAKQGHHHYGDQAARRPHTMCSMRGRRFTTSLFGVRGDWDELIR